MNQNYSICPTEQLYQLCNRKNWFTCGDNKQYTKFFEANRNGASLKEMAVILWICSSNYDHSLHPVSEFYNELISSREHSDYIKMLSTMKEREES